MKVDCPIGKSISARRSSKRFRHILPRQEHRFKGVHAHNRRSGTAVTSSVQSLESVVEFEEVLIEALVAHWTANVVKT
jgi:hypothetical protein